MDKANDRLPVRIAGDLPALRSEMLDIMESISASVPKRRKNHRIKDAQSVHCVSVSARAETMLVGSRQAVKIVNLKTGCVERTLADFPKVTAVFLNFPGDFLAVAADSSAALLHCRNADWRQDFSGHEADIASVCLDLRGIRLFTASADRTARMWDTRTGKSMVTYNGHLDTVRKVAVDLFETRVFTASADGKARCFDLRSGECRAEFCGHDAAVNDLEVSRRLLATGSDDGTAKLWDQETRRCIATIPSPSPVTAIRLSADGSRLALGGSDGSVCLWDFSKGEWVTSAKPHSPGTSAIDISRDQRLVVSAGLDGTVCVWDLACGRPLATFYNLGRGFLWTTPSDEIAPNGWLWTDTPGTLEVIECGECGDNPVVLGELERKEYLSMYHSEKMVLKRINDYPEYENLLRQLSEEDHRSWLDSCLRREQDVKRLTKGNR